MAGLLNQPKQAQAMAGGKITQKSVREQMQLTPQQAQQLDRIVLAGKKAMFSAKSHKLFLEQLKGPGTIEMKLGQGVAGLMALLAQESKGSLPPPLLIPAGLVLLAVAADFLRESGTDVPDDAVAGAIEIMVNAILTAVGIDPDKVAAAADRGPAPKGAPKPPAKAPMGEAPGVAA
jgi:hypothetical protein